MCLRVIKIMQEEIIKFLEDKGLFCSATKVTTKLPYFRSALSFSSFSRFRENFGHIEVMGELKIISRNYLTLKDHELKIKG